MRWIRDRGLGVIFFSLFLATWIAQLIVQWAEFTNQQEQHNEKAEFWSDEFWNSFWQATLENWQSEFLQLAVFTIFAAYFVYKGSAESKDSDERMEVLLEEIAHKNGIDPADVHGALQKKYQRRA